MNLISFALIVLHLNLFYPTVLDSDGISNQADQFVELGDSLMSKSEFNEALINFKLADSLYQTFDDSKSIMAVKSKIVYSLVKAGLRDNARTIAQKNIEFARKYGYTNTIEAAVVFGDIAHVYVKQNKFDSAKKLFEKSLDIIKLNHLNAYTESAKIYFNYAELLFKLNEYDNALNYTQKSLKIKIDSVGHNHSDVGYLYNSMSIINRSLGNLKEAVAYQKKSIDILRNSLGEQSLGVGTAYSSNGSIYYSMGKYDSSLYCYFNAKDIYAKFFGDSSLKMARVYSNIGLVYSHLGQYSESLTYNEMALSSTLNSVGSDHVLTANVYHNISSCYMWLGQLSKSQEYLEHALAIYKNVLPENHEKIALAYNNLGNKYIKTRNFQLSEKYLFASLDMFTKLFGSNHHFVSIPHSNLGVLYNEQKKFDLARHHYFESIQLKIKTAGIYHPDIALLYYNIGNTYKSTNEFSEALKYYNKALKVQKRLWKNKHHDISRTYNAIASVLQAKNDYIQAIKYFDLSIKFNLRDSLSFEQIQNQSVDLYFSPIILVEALIGKAECTTGATRLLTDVNQLNKVLRYYEIADILLNQTRKLNVNFDDKQVISNLARSVYDKAVELCFLISKDTSNQTYHDAALYFIEKGKSRILNDAAIENSTKLSIDLPQSITSREQSLKIRKSLLISDLNKHVFNNELNNTIQLKNDLFKLNRSIDSLTDFLSKNYPRYHRLLYQNNSLSLPKIQHELNKHTAVLEFYIGDSNIYLVTVIKNQTRVYQFLKTTELINSIEILTKKVNINFRYSSENNDYSSGAYLVYERILNTALNEFPPEISKLIIIPDGELGYIPFDILLTEKITDPKLPYKDWPFLIKKYKTQYAYSATLLFNDFERKELNESDDFIAFAPSFENFKFDSIRSLPLGRFRDQLTNLKWNESEVKNIANYLDGELYTGKNALERYFKKSAKDHSIIHLATHAFIDDEDPMNSKFVFAQEKDSVEDNFLHAYELYNMELPAQMAVLSACETGYGKLERGEGIMSLARAFSYAGCPSVVMSHWAVNDASTSKLMNHFYKYLSEGRTKDEALQMAKLEYLENADPAQAHPFYWGSFIVLGDVSPLKLSNKKFWTWIYVIGVLVLISAVVAYRRRRS